ncbi:MAG: CotH kinase family protein [Clostridia bacterium]|nr:CotH kinase family protein [Clostridia bacterium]
MKRIQLLAMMAALLAGLCCVVLLASPYAPVVAPAPEDIEVIWAIEDARVESDVPLVTALENHGMRLGYDAQENTFYCPIGLNTGDEWPQLHLTAPGAKGVELVFVDDYSYDWPADALCDGYPYQILAYTDTEFAYAQIVFTGLPVVTIETADAITYEDTAAQVTMASPEGGMTARAMTHLRGAGSAFSEKKSYKIDFVHGQKDSSAIAEVPGLGQADNIILLAGVLDPSLIRDRLSWDAYAMIAQADEPYGPRRTQYAEVFVNDRYAGVYIMMEPVDNGEELQKRGQSAPMTDSVYRSAQIAYAGERAYIENAARADSIYEVYHAPDMSRAFDALQAYVKLETLPQGEAYDAEFERLAMAHIDLESIMRYYLFVQGGGMSDNVYNNMYVVASRENGKIVYRFAPWDMDLTWGRFMDSSGEDFYHDLFTFGVVARMLEIDAGGVTRSTLTDMWRQMRETVFTLENVERMVEGYVYELDASGAYMRDALRWHGEERLADGYEIVTFAAEHFPALDEVFARYAGE